MLYQPVPPLVRRWLAALLSLLLGLGPLATPAYAGLTPLADEPINIKNQAKPNIILTVDDSTSMLYDFLPDYVVSKYCRDGTGAMNAPCGYSGSPASAGPGGQYVSPQYIWAQPALATLSTVAAPFPAYGTGAGAVPAGFTPQLFSNSGPGAGCNLTPTFPNPPSCTGGIDPGALPGLSIYPVASGSPQAGLPYEYWELWPAPAHNSALNHMYYNPRLTYDPPVYSDASSYPQMDSGNTSAWTKVRADPFTTADPLDCSSEPCVDLTANVIVGQWCNSDWTQGNDDSGAPFVTNPGHCRVNGLVAAASAGSPAALGDYLYPWAPTGITPNDVTTKVDTSVVSISPPTNATVKPAWTGAQDAKYFYENDNVLWCDITSPDWPQTGPMISQTCTNKTTPQTCTPNATQPTCGGSVTGACGGVVAAGSCSATTTGNCNGFVSGGQCTGWAANGKCNGYIANGKCSGYSANGQCTGFIAGVCSATATGTCSGFSNGVCTGFSNGVCNGGVAAACASPPTCGGAAAAACGGVTKEACVAGTAAACNGLVPQTCNGGTPIACNAVPQTCNGGGAQTCANIVEIPPDPSTCSSAWVPTDCNLDPDPEGTCVYTTTCPPPTFAGKCSIQTTKVCTADADCPFINGVCSVAGNSCASNSDCNLKRCQSTTTDCTSNAAICGNVTGTGRCSATNAVCTTNADCPSRGTCNYQTTGGVANGACSTAADCKAFPNHCATTTATTCTTIQANSASCPVVPNSGACNYQNNAGTTLGPCTVTGDCKAKPNVCNNPANKACPGGISDCTQGTCNYQNNSGVTNGPCVVVGDCKAKPSTCANNGATKGTVCLSAAACTDNGACTNAGATNGNACTAAATCTDPGTCTTGNVGAGCTATGAQCALVNGVCTSGDPAKNGQPCTTGTAATACQKPGACSTGSVGTPCFTTSASDVTCKKSGACTTGNIGAVCNSTSNTDVSCKVTGACSTGNIGAVCNSTSTTDVACTKAGACTTGFIGAVCNSNSATDAACAQPGACTSGNIGASCTAPNGPTAQCALTTGVCTGGANNGASCTLATQATDCAGAPGKCTAGQPNTTSCNIASDCNIGSVCSNSQSNGAACSVPGDCTPLNGTCSNDGSLCTTNAQCTALVGTCSITGASCTADNQCPSQPGPTNPLTGVRCDTGGVSGNALTTLLADANGAGKACRRNNHAYASDGTTAAQTNYPSRNFTTPVTGEIVAGQGCHTTDRYASVPRHYWKTEVEWCDKAISTAGDQWLGYGTPTGGSCQSFKDASHVFPRFYQFGAAPGTDNVSQAAFARVDLVPAATYTHTWTDDSGTVQTVTRTYADEMTNYANWFAYYRTRLTAVKTVTSLAFLGETGGTLNLDDQFRVGFHTMFSYATSFVDIADFDAGQKATWATQLMGVKIPLGQETPTLNTISRIGEYYLNGSNPSLPGSTDPIILSCQKNWHMFFTDGFTNQALPLPPLPLNDQDNTVPSPQLPVGGTAVVITGLTPGSAWPPPFQEDMSSTCSVPCAVSNSASDYVTNYWVTNLRPAMPENVATSARDPASWPHVNFAAMSLGTEGILPSGNQSNVEAQLTAGTLQWPKPQPTVNKPDQSGVDDLWHAAINGRGRFVNAQSADELKLGMGQILQDVVNQAGARTGTSFQSTSISGTNNFIYRTSFQPGWGSSLRKVQIDPVTGAEISVAWDASTQLATQLTVVPGVKDTPWFTDRMVVTMDDTGNAVPFLDSSIGAAQLDSLAPGLTTRAQAILAFLRGDRSKEGTSVGQFRVRIGGLLGDIVDSQPVYVGPPAAPYLEINDPGYTTNFRNNASFSTRPARIYVGANDGMLHAFDDATGNEAWAYVPSDLYRPDETGLGALSYQDGALPPFKHHFYVDATPRISDANFGGGPTDWHTMLVGGLGKGGKSYYALDISQPNDITSETEAAKRVLWQFTDADMGYTYGRAIIAKTHAFSNQWLVIVPSGYNNASGVGKVFFLRASDGKLLKTLSTGAGTPTNPSGLAQIAAYEKDFRNQFAEQIYGGDLLGNFWRFDISDPDDTNWGAAEKIATLTDPVGNPQAVTTPPQIEIDISNGIDRWVFVGTGRLLDDLDLTTPAIADQIQTMYAFRDGTAGAPVAPWPATLAPRTDMAEVTDAAGLAAKPDNGWYDDLPLGQRIVVPVQAALSVIAYVGTSPQTDPCLTGQPATLYAREYARGNSLLTDDSGATVESLFENQGIVGLELVVLNGGSTDSGAGGFPDLRIAITAGAPNVPTNFPKPKAPDFAQKHRMSWRLLGQ